MNHDAERRIAHQEPLVEPRHAREECEHGKLDRRVQHKDVAGDRVERPPDAHNRIDCGVVGAEPHGITLRSSNAWCRVLMLI